jgi:hypothetical protein
MYKIIGYIFDLPYSLKFYSQDSFSLKNLKK